MIIKLNYGHVHNTNKQLEPSQWHVMGLSSPCLLSNIWLNTGLCHVSENDRFNYCERVDGMDGGRNDTEAGRRVHSTNSRAKNNIYLLTMRSLCCPWGIVFIVSNSWLPIKACSMRKVLLCVPYVQWVWEPWSFSPSPPNLAGGSERCACK